MRRINEWSKLTEFSHVFVKILAGGELVLLVEEIGHVEIGGSGRGGRQQDEGRV